MTDSIDTNPSPIMPSYGDQGERTSMDMNFDSFHIGELDRSERINGGRSCKDQTGFDIFILQTFNFLPLGECNATCNITKARQ